MFHNTIPWALFRKHSSQISLLPLSQSFTFWHQPNGRSVLSCISLLHRGRGPSFLFFFFCSGFMFDCLTYGNAFLYLVLVFLFASTHWVTRFEVEDFYTEVGAVLVVRAPVRSCCDRDCDRCDRYTCWVRYWVYSTDTVGNPEKSTLGWHTVYWGVLSCFDSRF